MKHQKPGMFQDYKEFSLGVGSWLLALMVVVFAFWLGWQIVSAAQRIGNPWNRIAAQIERVAK